MNPEEVVRQNLLKNLIHEKGYPKSLLVVEQKLSTLPHLSQISDLPERRVDLLCYNRDLSPLLLIECKAALLTKKAYKQVLGYNYYIEAPFIALTNGMEFILGWQDGPTKCFQFIHHLPSYDEIVQRKLRAL